MTMTRDHAIHNELICAIESSMSTERAPFIRITNWYAPSENWMLDRARQNLAGCNFIVVVNKDKQAIYRHKKQVVNVEEE